VITVMRPSVFQPFSEAEPFAAILVSHVTHVFMGRTPEAHPKSQNLRQIKDLERDWFFRRGQWAPFPPARVSRGELLAPPVGFGAETDSKYIFGPTKSL